MHLNFSRTPEYQTRKLPKFRGYLAMLGPGIVWMALAQGSGELIWWPYLCSKYGLGFLFLLAPACLLQYPITFEIGRYSAFTGESIWKGFIRLGPAFAFVLWLLMIVSFLWFGAFASAGGTALAHLINWPQLWTIKQRSLLWATITILIFAHALLTQKRIYQLIEKIMWVVAIVTVVGLAISCTSTEVRPYWPSFLKGIVTPAGLGRSWDSSDINRLLTAITFAGLGGFWTLFYSYWILGKGTGHNSSSNAEQAAAVPTQAEGSLKEEGIKWRRVLLLDSGIGIFGNLFTTLMTCFLAYAILYPRGIIPDNWSLAAEQSRFFEEIWGLWGRGLFLVIAGAFLCDTWLSTADGVARVNLEMIRHYFFSDANWNQQAWYKSMIVVLTAITGITMFLTQPGHLIVLSAIIGFAGTVIFSIALINLIHGQFKDALPAELKPGNVSLTCMTISAGVYILLAAAYLVVLLK